jgi:hypothetical protein
VGGKAVGCGTHWRAGPFDEAPVGGRRTPLGHEEQEGGDVRRKQEAGTLGAACVSD